MSGFCGNVQRPPSALKQQGLCFHTHFQPCAPPLAILSYSFSIYNVDVKPSLCILNTASLSLRWKMAWMVIGFYIKIEAVEDFDFTAKKNLHTAKLKDKQTTSFADQQISDLKDQARRFVEDWPTIPSFQVAWSGWCSAIQSQNVTSSAKKKTDCHPARWALKCQNVNCSHFFEMSSYRIVLQTHMTKEGDVRNWRDDEIRKHGVNKRWIWTDLKNSFNWPKLALFTRRYLLDLLDVAVLRLVALVFPRSLGSRTRPVPPLCGTCKKFWQLQRWIKSQVMVSIHLKNMLLKVKVYHETPRIRVKIFKKWNRRVRFPSNDLSEAKILSDLRSGSGPTSAFPTSLTRWHGQT